MPALGNRKAAIKRNISGGTTAPPGAAKSHTTGLGAGQPAPNPGKLGQAQGLSAAPQPGTAAPVQPQKPLMPWDLQAANSEAGSQRKLANDVTGLDAGWFRAQQEYGLEGPWADPASNPTSRAALLQRSYDNAKSGAMNSAGRNLYAGSYINAQNSNTHQFTLGRDELQKGYGQANAEYVAGKARAEDEAREAMNQAGWERINAGLEAPLEPAPAGAPKKAPPKKPRKDQIKQNIAPARKAR